MSAGRPHLLLDATPERTPWLSAAKFNETEGLTEDEQGWGTEPVLSDDEKNALIEYLKTL